MGSGLGIATTAEGVETAEQFDQLKLEGCTEVQGYLFSPPRACGGSQRAVGFDQSRAQGDSLIKAPVSFFQARFISAPWRRCHRDCS